MPFLGFWLIALLSDSLSPFDFVNSGRQVLEGS